VRRLLALAVIGIIGLGTPARADDDGTAPRTATGYRAGKKFKIKIVSVDGRDIEVKTARAYTAMRDAAAAAGVGLQLNSGFRTNEDQQMFYLAWKAGLGARAARPGFSNHQSGRALDIDVWNYDHLVWLEANAARFGFKRTVDGEPWHWEYSPRYVVKPRSRHHRAVARPPKPHRPAPTAAPAS
jgi:D-alanyl-D-alanine carboxypeptidase